MNARALGRLGWLVAATLAACVQGGGADDGAPFDAGDSDARPPDPDADAGTQADAGEPDAGPDLSGSCAGLCGRSAPAGCRCDDACAAGGGCCEDYASACGLEAELRAEMTTGHVTRSYTAGRDLMYGITGSVDVVGGRIECVYTGVTAMADGTRTPEGAFNTEHVWPRSQGEPAGSSGDLYNLRPTLEAANTERASHPFGEAVCDGATCPYALGGSERGTDATGQMVFEVRAETRGDIARSMLYFAIRYGLDIAAPEEAVLRSWHLEDPPSLEELTRVDEIEAVQGNRNVFVDRPDWVEQIPDF